MPSEAKSGLLGLIPWRRSHSVHNAAAASLFNTQRGIPVKAHVLVCFLAYAIFRTLGMLAKNRGLAMSPRRILDTLANIHSGDIILPLVDRRELRLRRISRPDSAQAEILRRLDLNLPDRVGTDTVAGEM
jgi:hypothetical protein